VAGIAERAAYPEYDDSLPVATARPLDGDRWEAFCERFVAVHGMPLETPQELVEFLKSFGYRRGYCDPALQGALAPYFGPDVAIEETFDRARLDDYQFGITRARAAIAETGSLVVTDRGTSSRLAALAPWVHIACIRRDEIFRDTPAAVADLGEDPNVIWITGPSKTADVEGILIEGVHGPGVQICLLLPEEAI
jgi:L-lactate dehydrogenase complex protein LldG